MRNIFLALFLMLGASSLIAQPYYVAGDFQGWTPGSNIMFDDGTNGDLVAGDSIYSLSFIVTTAGYHGWKVTPGTWATTWPAANAWFETITANQQVLFTFDTRHLNDGWLPNNNIVNTNEVKPVNLVAVGDWQSEAGAGADWLNNSTLTAMRDDGLDGDRVANDGVFVYHINNIPAGTWLGKGVHSGTWHSWGADGRSEDGWNLQFTTIAANQHVYIYVNTNTGRVTYTLDFPVPVELTSFTANVVDGNVILTWSTATELNNHGFDIERMDKNVNAINSTWEKIVFVKGNGTVTTTSEYTYTDKVVSGNYAYRLKQIDFDGSFSYYNPVNVLTGVNTIVSAEFKLLQNYPNPFNPETVIGYQLPQNGNVTIRVYDILGNEAAELVNKEQTAGSYSVKFDASKLNSGIYFAVINANGRASSIKMSLMK